MRRRDAPAMAHNQESSSAVAPMPPAPEPLP
jgi:hypothetical protein